MESRYQRYIGRQSQRSAWISWVHRQRGLSRMHSSLCMALRNFAIADDSLILDDKASHNLVSPSARTMQFQSFGYNHKSRTTNRLFKFSGRVMVGSADRLKIISLTCQLSWRFAQNVADSRVWSRHPPSHEKLSTIPDMHSDLYSLQVSQFVLLYRDDPRA
jgi:hypothetical protein